MKTKQIFYQPILTPDEWTKGELSSFMVYRQLANAKADYPSHQIAAYEEGDIEDPTFVDDEDDRTQTFYIDVPPVNGQPEWHNVESFKTREEAIEFAKEKFGADENGMVCLLSVS